jgi:FkbM family methyltransferase
MRSFAKALVPPLALAAGRYLRQRVSQPEPVAEELRRLESLPRYQRDVTEIFGRRFEFLDGPSFAHLYRVFFEQQTYRFSSGSTTPYIIDCGAHIGVSVAWWKTLFPAARVLAFEPDPVNYEMLRRNCAGLADVEVINAAVWREEGVVDFTVKGDQGGHLTRLAGAAHPDVQPVRCLRLRPLLERGCDFVKLDIEGAEIEVIRDCADLLHLVERMAVEYHSFVGRPQRLGETIRVLESAGFRVHAHVELPSPRPFEECVVVNDKDLRLDLFCFRTPGEAAV